MSYRLSFTVFGSTHAEIEAEAMRRIAEFFGPDPTHHIHADIEPESYDMNGGVQMYRAEVTVISR